MSVSNVPTNPEKWEFSGIWNDRRGVKENLGNVCFYREYPKLSNIGVNNVKFGSALN